MSRLHRAVRLALIEDVDECLAAGDEVNALGIRDTTPLMIAAHAGFGKIVGRLLQAGADVSIAQPNGRTALHMAAAHGEIAVVRMLLDAGADLNGASRNGASRNGETPAIEATQFNHRDVVDLLFASGANRDPRDRKGRTAEDWLAQGGLSGASRSIFERLRASDRPRDVALIRKLMAECPSPDAYAARHGRRICVWSYRREDFEDPDLQDWVERLAAILFTPGLLDVAEEQYLTGADLEDARRHRARRERFQARERIRKQRCEGAK